MLSLRTKDSRLDQGSPLNQGTGSDRLWTAVEQGMGMRAAVLWWPALVMAVVAQRNYNGDGARPGLGYGR